MPDLHGLVVLGTLIIMPNFQLPFLSHWESPLPWFRDGKYNYRVDSLLITKMKVGIQMYMV